jgi:hypothetical protein
MGLGDFLGGLIGSHTDEVKPVVTAQQIHAQNIGLDPTVSGQQGAYASYLNNQMNGQGPSLAANMLKGAQDQAAGNASSMAAGRRGVNPAMALRQAQYAMAGSNQGAANAAANARVQEQMGSENMYGNQLTTQQNQNLDMQRANQVADLQAGMSNQNAQNQANQINAGIAMDNTKTNNQVTGGVLSGISGALGFGSSKAHGGFIKHLASGGFADMGTDNPNPYGGKNPYADSFKFKMPSFGGLSGEKLAGGPMDAAGGGDALSELGPAALLASKGGKIPGKANVKGDSLKNDVVPTMLSPDELVIPRSVSTSPEFIKKLEAIVSDMPGKGPQGFSKVLAARKGRA